MSKINEKTARTHTILPTVYWQAVSKHSTVILITVLYVFLLSNLWDVSTDVTT